MVVVKIVKEGRTVLSISVSPGYEVVVSHEETPQESQQVGGATVIDLEKKREELRRAEGGEGGQTPRGVSPEEDIEMLIPRPRLPGRGGEGAARQAEGGGGGREGGERQPEKQPEDLNTIVKDMVERAMERGTQLQIVAEKRPAGEEKAKAILLEILDLKGE